MRILKPLAVSIVLLLASITVEATTPFDTNFIGKTVVFLYGAKPDKTVDNNAPLGTGFLVRVPDSSPLGVTFILVTARHIVDPEWVHCPNKVNPEVMFARINSLNPSGDEKVRYIRLSLLHLGQPTWFKHTRDDIDAAVLLFPTSDEDLRKGDLRALPIWRLPTEEELSKLSIGDDIVSAGMLVDLRGTQRNYPVFKFGKISSIPTEDVQTSCAGATPPGDQSMADRRESCSRKQWFTYHLLSAIWREWRY